MSFNFFSPEQSPTPTTQNDNKIEEFDKIATHLCDQRKAIEWNLENRTPDTREVYQHALEAIKIDMVDNNVDEEYYQTYLKKHLH